MRFIRVKFPGSAREFWEGIGLDRPTDAAAIDPELTSDRADRPTLSVPRFDLLVAFNPSLSPGFRCNGWQPRRHQECRREGHDRVVTEVMNRDQWGDRKGGRPFRYQDRFQRQPGLTEDFFKRSGQILHQVKAVKHLLRLRCAATHPIGKSFVSVTGHDLNSRVSVQPCAKCRCFAIGEQSDRSPCFEINQNRSIPLPFPYRPIVNAKNSRRGKDGAGHRTDQAQQRTATHRHALLRREASTSSSTQGQTKLTLIFGEPQRSSGPRSDH